MYKNSIFFFMIKQALMNKITLSNRKKCHSKKMSQFCSLDLHIYM